MRTIHQVPFIGASDKGDSPSRGILDVATVEATGLGDLSALIVTGDLQFREIAGDNANTGRLLGERLADELATLADLGELPPKELTGVILTGDLYCSEDFKSGATGDVRSVWETFDSQFAFVSGVVGNHDALGDLRPSENFRFGPGRYLLEDEVVTVCGLTFGGVGGVIGNPERPNRRNEGTYIRLIEGLLGETLDALVLHESPGFPANGLIGNERLRTALEAVQAVTVFCGHSHWSEPFLELPSGLQVINVDSRCLVLVSAR
jgi:hypothetical protein